MGELFSTLGDDHGRIRAGLVVRRTVLALFLVVAVLALLNVAGQEDVPASASASAATLSVSMPERVRGGLFWQARFDVRARRALEQPRLVLGRGWTEGMQVNSIEPAAVSEGSRDGRLELRFEPLDAGQRLRVWLQFQVEPTTMGTRDAGVALTDGTTPITSLDRDLTVLP